MQEVWAGVGDQAQIVRLPPHNEHVISGVPWGFPDRFNTPAYWAVRCRWHSEAVPNFASKEPSLIEEVGFCLLGGFGIRFEVNAAAFDRLRTAGCFDLTRPALPEDRIRLLLLKPLAVGSSKIRYRFPNQRAHRLAKMRHAIADWDLSDLSATDLRRKLMTLEGVGPKTASWIVRNCRGSDEVAIIDVHLIRACRAMNIFPDSFVLPRDYDLLERRFLEFAEAIEVRPSILDAVIWTEARRGIHNTAVR